MLGFIIFFTTCCFIFPVNGYDETRQYCLLQCGCYQNTPFSYWKNIWPQSEPGVSAKQYKYCANMCNCFPEYKNPVPSSMVKPEYFEEQASSDEVASLDSYSQSACDLPYSELDYIYDYLVPGYWKEPMQLCPQNLFVRAFIFGYGKANRIVGFKFYCATLEMTYDEIVENSVILTISTEPDVNYDWLHVTCDDGALQGFALIKPVGERSGVTLKIVCGLQGNNFGPPYTVLPAPPFCAPGETGDTKCTKLVDSNLATCDNKLICGFQIKALFDVVEDPYGFQSGLFVSGLRAACCCH